MSIFGFSIQYTNLSYNKEFFIKNIHKDKSSAYSKYMGDVIFKVPTALMFSKIVDAIDKLSMNAFLGSISSNFGVSIK